MINAVWISISDPVEFFRNPVQPDPVLNCRIQLDRDPESGLCSTLIVTKQMTNEKLCVAKLAFFLMQFTD